MRDTDKYVFFIDIDDTLMVGGRVSVKNRIAVERARKEGHKVFINTARSYGIVPDKIKNLRVDGFVTALGCNVKYRKKEIYSAKMSLEESAEILDYFTKTKRIIHLEGDSVFLSNSEEGFPVVFSGEELLKKYPGENIPKFFIPHILKTEEQKYLSEKYNFYQHECYAEFCLKGNSKATGIRRVMDYLGLDMSRSVAMGDSLNDLEMLECAGISVAMGDGVEKVRAAADIVTCPASDGGVADGIYRII